MGFRRSFWHWYNLIFLGLAFVIVFPREVLEWIGDRTNRIYGLRHVVLLEVVAVSLMVGMTKLLMPMYPQLHWWQPLVFIGALGVLRAIKWFVAWLCDFDE